MLRHKHPLAWLNVTESQNHRMVGVGRDLWGHPVQPSCPSRVTQSRLQRTLSRRGWNISREGDSTASLGSLGQGSVTLRGKKFFLGFRRNFLCFSLCPLPLQMPAVQPLHVCFWEPPRGRPSAREGAELSADCSVAPLALVKNLYPSGEFQLPATGSCRARACQAKELSDSQRLPGSVTHTAARYLRPLQSPRPRGGTSCGPQPGTELLHRQHPGRAAAWLGKRRRQRGGSGEHRPPLPCTPWLRGRPSAQVPAQRGSQLPPGPFRANGAAQQTQGTPRPAQQGGWARAPRTQPRRPPLSTGAPLPWHRHERSRPRGSVRQLPRTEAGRVPVPGSPCSS